MATTKVSVVSDAGPLIHLDELDVLDLLDDLGTVHVPQIVWDEVATHRPNLKPERSWLAISREDVSPTSEIFALSRALGLHRGEVSALTLCHSCGANLFLSDDSAARLAAESLGIRVHGTLGVLLRSIRRGMREKDKIVSMLRSIPTHSTLHIRSTLLQEVIQNVQEFEE